jgi:hypothetical protein
MSIAVETTKLILEHLKGIFPDAECKRSYIPVLDPAELAEIGKTVLCVTPAERDAEKYTQGGLQKNDLSIDICINAKLDHRNDDLDASNAEIDALIDFAEVVYSAFLKKIVSTQDGVKVTLDQPEHLILCDYDMIRERNCFLSIVRVNAEVFVKPEV